MPVSKPISRSKSIFRGFNKPGTTGRTTSKIRTKMKLKKTRTIKGMVRRRPSLKFKKHHKLPKSSDLEFGKESVGLQ